MAELDKGAAPDRGAGLERARASRDEDAVAAFAEELKAWRAARGWTQGELAARINYSEALIAQVETCRKPATMQLAEALDRTLATPGYTSNEPGNPSTPGTFMRIAKRIRKMSFPVAFRPFTDAEEEATALYIFEHALFPGLFQTEDYAREVLATYPRATDEQIDDRLAARLSRQDILERNKPPRIWLLLNEPVLRGRVGSPKTMNHQLLRMAEASRRPNVAVQVLPEGLHIAMQGSFHVAEVDGVCTAAFIEDAIDGRTTQNPAILNQLSDFFRYLQMEAMSPNASRDFMERLAEELWSEP
jgi:transcriptional regulator with XRE-family HTH domain